MTTKWYLYEDVWQIAGVWEVGFLPFLLSENVEGWDEEIRALKNIWSDTLSHFLHWLPLNLWATRWGQCMAKIIIVTAGACWALTMPITELDIVYMSDADVHNRPMG